MANVSEHIEQWRHNRSFLCTIPPEYPDWMVTAAFYVAVHAVDTLLAHDGQTVTAHKDRNDIIMHTNRYLQIRKHYLQLFDLSRTVRYLAKPTEWTPAETIMEEVIRGLLYPIEKSVIKLSGQTVNLPEITLRTEPASTPVAQSGQS